MLERLRLMVRALIMRGLLLKERIASGASWNPIDPE